MDLLSRFLIALIAPIAIAGCGAKASANVSLTEEEMVISSKRYECYGAFKQYCYRVKKGDGNWSYFYSTIKGFEYQEGFEYKIRYSKERVSSPMQDASSYRYFLKKIEYKIPKAPF